MAFDRNRLKTETSPAAVIPESCGLRSDHGSEIDRMHIRFLGSEEDGGKPRRGSRTATATVGWMQPVEDKPNLDNAEQRALAEPNTVLLGLVGSTVHGVTVDDADDRDEMGICIEPPEYVAG